MLGQQFQVQLEALKELNAYLPRVINDLQMVMRSYSETVSKLQERGLPMEVHDKVKSEFYMQSQNFVTQCCGIISEQTIPYVRQQIQGLEGLLNR